MSFELNYVKLNAVTFLADHLSPPAPPIPLKEHKHNYAFRESPKIDAMTLTLFVENLNVWQTNGEDRAVVQKLAENREIKAQSAGAS